MKYVIVADLGVLPAFIKASFTSTARKYDTFGISETVTHECLYDKAEAFAFAERLRGSGENNTHQIPVYVVPESEAQDKFDLIRMEIAIGKAE